MTINEIFNELEKRRNHLEKVINEKIEGNTKENEYAYDNDTRKILSKELKVVENTIAFLDEEIYENMRDLTKN